MSERPGGIPLTEDDATWVFDRYQRFIDREARRHTGPDDAQDVAQDARVTLWRLLRQEKLTYPNDEQFKKLLREIVLHRFLDWCRARRRVPDPLGAWQPSDDSESDPGHAPLVEPTRTESTGDAHLLREFIEKTITAAPSNRRMANDITMWFQRHILGYDLASIGKEFGLSVPTVSNRVKWAAAVVVDLALEAGYRDSPIDRVEQADRALLRTGLLDYAAFLDGLPAPTQGQTLHGPAHAEAVRFVVLHEIDGLPSDDALARAKGRRVRPGTRPVRERAVGYQVIEMYLARPMAGGQEANRLVEYLSADNRASHPSEAEFPRDRRTEP